MLIIQNCIDYITQIKKYKKNSNQLEQLNSVTINS